MGEEKEKKRYKWEIKEGRNKIKVRWNMMKGGKWKRMERVEQKEKKKYRKDKSGEKSGNVEVEKRKRNKDGKENNKE